MGIAEDTIYRPYWTIWHFFLNALGHLSTAPILQFPQIVTFSIFQDPRELTGIFFLSTGNASRANAAAKAVVKGSSVRFHILESD